MKRLFDKGMRPNQGVWGLLIAIVISALLHFFWLTELTWELPKNTANLQVIDARLMTIKPTIVKKKEKETLEKAVAQPLLTTKKPSVVEKLPELLETESIAVIDEMFVEKEGLSSAVINEVANDSIEITPDASPFAPLDTAILAEPYSYIETTFDVYLNQSETRAGAARIIYDASELGRYKLQWTIEATGLLALFYPDLVQTSNGLIDEEFGLRPVNYRYQFGDKANKSYQAEFDWTNGVLLLHSSKGDKAIALTQNAQDYLSFMYQFMFNPPMNVMQISLTNGKRLISYDYTFEGEEVLKLDFGEVKTYHIKHAKSDSDEKTELWLAIDYQFIPVKISKTEKDGQVINQIAKVIYTKPVQLIQELPLP